MALTKITAKRLNQLATFGAPTQAVTDIKAKLDAAFTQIDANTAAIGGEDVVTGHNSSGSTIAN